MSGSKSESREKKTKTKTNTKKKKKKKNSGKEAKQKPLILTVSSFSDSEERNEVEEEAKSSNNSNQHMNDETLDDDHKDKNVSTGSGNGGGASGSGSCFPTNRIQRIIRSEGTDFRITQEAIFLINKATEHFLEIFCEDAYACGRQDRQKAVSYRHLSSVVGKGRRYDFLSDFVPEKVRAEDALSERLAET